MERTLPKIEGIYGEQVTLSSIFDASYRLAVSDARIALPNFYNVAVGIANVAARLAVLGHRLRDELGSSTFP